MMLTMTAEPCRFGHKDEAPSEVPRHCEITGEVPRTVDRYDANDEPAYCTCPTCASYASACGWCGGAFPPDPPDKPVSLCRWCCDLCSKAWTDKYQPGQWVSIGDMTPEQLNEALNDIGLGLEGVGPRRPS